MSAPTDPGSEEAGPSASESLRLMWEAESPIFDGMPTLRPRAVRGVLAAAILLIGAPSAAGNAFYDDLRAARAFAAKGELARAKTEFERLDRVADGLPSATYALAQIEARLGNRAEALRRLRAYAAMGLARDVTRDSSFASLVADSAFAGVARRLRENRAPVSVATVARMLNDSSLLAEDLAYDPRSRSFFVSSVHRGTILVVDSTGATREFIPAGSERGWGVYGLAYDAPRGLLWGSLAATPTVLTYVSADSGRTGVAAWDVLSGERRVRVDLPPDGGRHVLGDLALAPDGTLYATDSVGGGLYALRPGTASFDTLAAPGTFASPQSPLVVEPGRRLWVADYPRGIVEFDLRRRSVRPIAKPRSVALSGIDGLAFAGARIVAVQNGTSPARVLLLSTAAGRASIVGARVLEQGSDLMGEANHAVAVGDTLYFVGNSGWNYVRDDETFEAPAGATSPMILRLTLPAPSKGGSPARSEGSPRR